MRCHMYTNKLLHCRFNLKKINKAEILTRCYLDFRNLLSITQEKWKKWSSMSCLLLWFIGRRTPAVAQRGDLSTLLWTLSQPDQQKEKKNQASWSWTRHDVTFRSAFHHTGGAAHCKVSLTWTWCSQLLWAFTCELVHRIPSIDSTSVFHPNHKALNVFFFFLVLCFLSKHLIKRPERKNTIILTLAESLRSHSTTLR